MNKSACFFKCILVVVFGFSYSSSFCQLDKIIINKAKQLKNTTTSVSSLSENEIIQGLKEALSIGTDKTVKNLIKTDAYFNDALIKILLPAEHENAIKNLKAIVGESLYAKYVKSTEDKLLKSLNNSAEDAANKAAPIFKNAITNMSFTDAKSILKGADTAATNYLRSKTYNNLVALYAPKIDSSLNKPLYMGVSSNTYYAQFTKAYNSCISAYNSVNIFSSKPIAPLPTTSLGNYVTKKGLNGLFTKVKDEEKAIRKDPVNRVTDILRKVFAQ
jgi:hypothetical protein